jgi:hypothetical protein
MTELFVGDTWLYSQLEADSTLAALGIYGHVVPEGESFPLVQFRALSNTDSQAGVGAYIIMSNLLYVVVAVQEFRSGRPSFQPLEGYADRIHTQLHKTSGTIVGGQVLASTRDNPFRNVYQQDGITYYELGGIYRVYATDS